MRSAKGKLVACLTAAGCLVMALVAALAFRRTIVEEWNVWMADNGTDDEKRMAVRSLLEIKSVTGLLRLMRGRPPRRSCVEPDGNLSLRLSLQGELARNAIVQLGRAALPSLGKELSRNAGESSFFAAYMMERIVTGRWTGFRLGPVDEASYAAQVREELRAEIEPGR